MSCPIACALTDVEMRERRRTLLDLVQSAIIDTSDLPSGYLYRFDANDELRERLDRLVTLEGQCCPFLTFRLYDSGEGTICLEIAGPPEAKSIIADIFGS
jgi:hypothetical protein